MFMEDTIIHLMLHTYIHTFTYNTTHTILLKLSVQFSVLFCSLIYITFNIKALKQIQIHTQTLIKTTNNNNKGTKSAAFLYISVVYCN